MTISTVEERNPETVHIDLMSTKEILQAINGEDHKVADAVQAVLPQIEKAVDVIVSCLSNGGRLGYFGAGTSGRLGVLDASDCWSTFGIETDQIQGFIAGGDNALRRSVERSEDKEELALLDLGAFKVSPKDVVVVISAAGNTTYPLTILKKAKEMGAKTIAICSNPKALIKADVLINPIVGPEVITGSSRLKSGTAQKMILNMLSTAAMIKMGKTYENLMVDVRVTSQKLYNRACDIIEYITGVSKTEARKYLDASGKNVKIACVMIEKDCNKEAAEKLLKQKGDILRKVI